MNLELNTLSKTRAKRSSSETLPKQSAHDAEWNGLCHDNTDLFSEMLEETLNCGHSIRFRAPGDSMYPTIRNGDVITVMPIETASINHWDIIIYRHKSGVTAHRVIHIAKKDAPHSQHPALRPQTSDLSLHYLFFLRGDAAIVFDDPVGAEQILGKVVSVERNGRSIDPYGFRSKLCFKARRFASCIKRFLFSHQSTST